MSALTTADLDGVLALTIGPDDQVTWLMNDYYRELVEAARLQVAIDELPLPEGWDLRIGAPGPRGPFASAFSRSSGDEEVHHGLTMLAAVLALDVALRSRA